MSEAIPPRYAHAHARAHHPCISSAHAAQAQPNVHTACAPYGPATPSAPADTVGYLRWPRRKQVESDLLAGVPGSTVEVRGEVCPVPRVSTQECPLHVRHRSGSCLPPWLAALMRVRRVAAPPPRLVRESVPKSAPRDAPRTRNGEREEPRGNFANFRRPRRNGAKASPSVVRGAPAGHRTPSECSEYPLYPSEYPRVSTPEYPESASVLPEPAARRRPTRSSCYSSGAPLARRGRALRALSERRCGRCLSTRIAIIGTRAEIIRTLIAIIGILTESIRTLIAIIGTLTEIIRTLIAITRALIVNYHNSFSGRERRCAVGPSAAIAVSRLGHTRQRSHSTCACALAAADRPFLGA